MESIAAESSSQHHLIVQDALKQSSPAPSANSAVASTGAAGAGPAATTVSNIKEVVLGDMWIAPWYPSFYPEELMGAASIDRAGASLDRLYVCPHCFKYTADLVPYRGHVATCQYHDIIHMLGSTVYQTTTLTVCEVDGEESKLFTQNLSLFSKLFLDTKSVFYDVTTFLYYLLIHTDLTSSVPKPQVVGFFSKEKLSWDNNNLACILIFPPWQRRGFGQVLMGLSYLISKRDGRIGGPEKPLSDSGRKAYLRFWAGAIARYASSVSTKRTITIREMSLETYITTEDLVMTLKEMQVLQHRKRTSSKALLNKAMVEEWVKKHNINCTDLVDYDAFGRHKTARVRRSPSDASENAEKY